MSKYMTASKEYREVYNQKHYVKEQTNVVLSFDMEFLWDLN